MMKVKKMVICGAAVWGIFGTVQAAIINNMTIEDTDGDGVAGGFAFATPGSTAYTYFFDSTSSVTFTLQGDTTTLSPSNSMGITANGSGEGTETFTAGFLFNGFPLLPTSLNATGVGLGTTTPDGIAGSINSGDTSLTMSRFHWSAEFGTNLFPMSPDAGFVLNTASQGTAGGSAQPAAAASVIRYVGTTTSNHKVVV